MTIEKLSLFSLGVNTVAKGGVWSHFPARPNVTDAIVSNKRGIICLITKIYIKYYIVYSLTILYFSKVFKILNFAHSLLRFIGLEKKIFTIWLVFSLIIYYKNRETNKITI